MFSRKSLYILLPFIALMMMACQITGIGNININRKTVRGNGTLATEDRSVSGFNQVSLAGFGTVNITQGSEESLSIEAEENLMEYITTEVVGGELRIGFKQDTNVQPTKGIQYHLTVKDLNQVAVSGAADVECTAFKTEKMKMDVSGAGKMVFNGLDVKDLTVNSSGAGTFTLAGTVDTQKVSLSGTGNYQAGDLKSRTASMTVSGAGNGTLWVTDSLNVEISGLGNVSYYGKPSVTKDVSGAGRVKDLGDK